VAILPDLLILHPVPDGEAGLPVKTENRARLRTWWTMAALAHRYLVEGIVIAAFVSLGLLRGKP
jgi:hypothetical protein